MSCSLLLAICLAAQNSPIDIRAQVFATDLAVGGALNGWAAFCGDAMEVARNPDGITLAMRSYGFGWFVFTLPERQAHFLVQSIIKRIGLPPINIPDLEIFEGKPN